MIASVAYLTMEELLKSEPKNLFCDTDGIGKAPYEIDTTKWLPIGCVYDHPKSWTFMSGGVAPGEGAVILYSIKVDGKMFFPDEFAYDRKEKISWYYRDGYQPCPVSIWKSAGIMVTVQHFSYRKKSEDESIIYSKVKLDNIGNDEKVVTLSINASKEIHFPINKPVSRSTNNSMEFDISMVPGQWEFFEFATKVSEKRILSENEIPFNSFEEAYSDFSRENNETLDRCAIPIKLPNKGIVNMYKAILLQLRNYVVYADDEVQMRSNAGNPARIQSYDRPFPHDIPNFVDQFMREGDFELGKEILASKTYRRMNSNSIHDWDDLNYMDTIGKFMIPYAQYLQSTGDIEYFDKELKEFLKKCARNIHAFRETEDNQYRGLMKKGEDFENWSDDGDYLLADNWCALHGLQSYYYIVKSLGDEKEAQWAWNEIEDLNNTVNEALNNYMAKSKNDYYLGAFNESAYQKYIAGSFYSWVPYGAGLSTFPWGAYLKGYELGGTWKEYFDNALEYSFLQRDIRQVPDGSFGAWWSKVTYGSVYNSCAGVQCLFSDKYRTEAIKSVEFLYNNQCAPFVWSEAFESKGRNQWAGMYLPQESYGNYEGWGSSFIKQAILQACISVKTDGTVIIGRGIPDDWLKDGDTISWKNVNINNGKKIDFEIKVNDSQIDLYISGDEAEGKIVFDLPIFSKGINTTSDGIISNKSQIILENDCKHVSVTIK